VAHCSGRGDSSSVAPTYNCSVHSDFQVRPNRDLIFSPVIGEWTVLKSACPVAVQRLVAGLRSFWLARTFCTCLFGSRLFDFLRRPSVGCRFSASQT
jgi:hypothetical protein